MKLQTWLKKNDIYTDGGFRGRGKNLRHNRTSLVFHFSSSEQKSDRFERSCVMWEHVWQEGLTDSEALEEKRS